MKAAVTGIQKQCPDNISKWTNRFNMWFVNPACFHFPGPVIQLDEYCCVPGGPPEHTAAEWGPARRPSCVCSEALIWAKMSRASFQSAERGQTLLPSREV